MTPLPGPIFLLAFRPSASASSALLLPLLFALLLLSGCGYKDWPRPVAAEDAFSLADAAGNRQGDCLTVAARVAGNAGRLSSIALLVEDSPAADYCPGCPFRPMRRVDFSLDDPRIMLQADRLALSWCGAEPGRRHRWQVLGISALRGLPPAASPVFSD